MNLGHQATTYRLAYGSYFETPDATVAHFFSLARKAIGSAIRAMPGPCSGRGPVL